jgi:hypothetical protein
MEPNSRSHSQDILRVLRNLKFHYYIPNRMTHSNHVTLHKILVPHGEKLIANRLPPKLDITFAENG